MPRKQWRDAGAVYRYMVFSVGEAGGAREVTLGRSNSIEDAEAVKRQWEARGYTVEIFDFEAAERMPQEIK
jgi:hypothetical protein